MAKEVEHLDSEQWTDPIVAEVRQWRDELMREAGYDIDKLVENLKKVRERYPNTKFVNRKTITLEELQARMRAINPEVYEGDERS